MRHGQKHLTVALLHFSFSHYLTQNYPFADVLESRRS